MSTRYPGGLITKTPVVPTINSAPGVWTLEQALVYIKAGTWPGGVTIDPYFNQTTLLLHGDGTNGAQNNTFLDSSTNNFTITRNGNTTQGTFSPFSLAAGQWSNYFSGNGNYISANPSTAVNFGSGSFTLEAWVYLTSMSTSATIIGTRTGDTSSTIRWVLYVISGTNTLEIDIWNTANARIAYFSHQTALSLNTWYHVAFVRNGTGFRLYLNGVQSTSSATSSDAVANSNTVVTIGQSNGGFSGTNAPLVGYISNARIVKGTALYTSSFTPPTTPLTNIANTSLLTCQSNRFVDNGTANSGSGFPISIVGSPRVTPFSPFAPTAAYSAGTNGGNGYFDGTGDYLTALQSTAFDLSGDFTVECWVYFSSVATTSFVGKWGGSGSYAWVLQYVVGTGLRFHTGVSGGLGTAIAGAWTAVANTWYHIAATRSSNSVRLFVDGVQVGSTTTNSDNCTATNQALNIGRNADTDIQYLTGYIANLRILKGTGYTTITVPTAPLTAITNTSLLLNFTNAGIIDNTGKNNLETVGNAQIDTTTKKFGTGSLEFDGSGDYLLTNGDTNNFAFGSGDFTIEFWVYPTSVSSSVAIIYDSRPASTQGLYPVIYLNNATIKYFVSSADRITGSSLSINTWYHIAITKSGTSTKMFVNGTQSGSTYTDSNSYVNAALRPVIGVSGFNLGLDPFTGYIDDLRITKGVARYTANFTPPTAAFPNQ